MTINQSALSTLISEVLADPDLAHSDVFRRMLQAGMQDLIEAEAAAKIGPALRAAHHASQRFSREDVGDSCR